MSSNDCITSAIPINNNPSQSAMDRRGSVGNAVFSNLFRSNSLSTHTTSIPETHRRRLSSVSVGLHQSGIVPPSTTPANFTLGPGHLRRTSTISLLDENAIEDDEMPSPLSGRSPPLSSISSRRASFARPRTVTDQQQQQQQHFTWADQLRSRAEGRSSTFVSGSPPRVSSFGPSSAMATSPSQQTHFHRRESSVSADAMPPFQNPGSATAPAPRPKPRQKPDAFQERILKGDFYMD
ncbi:hypothetical protein CFIMG_004376RAa [Ceratocystis fimbriata CBS 114723]|uniref:Uncharacterized protein n=1 Tax=Ceratocystis fimbriata CBS 114723 TaxID=1035309 RepID=A0A2C5WYK9_9PEZI|nr:hypothetical protein CFIMG_004376RAa [Ceratocystis fimbriata CBS 114723]